MGTVVASLPVVQVLVAYGLLILAVIVLGVGLWYYRRWLLRSNRWDAGTAWTFEDLRRMRDSGEITENEYEALRATMTSGYGTASSGSRHLAGSDDIRSYDKK